MIKRSCEIKIVLFKDCFYIVVIEREIPVYFLIRKLKRYPPRKRMTLTYINRVIKLGILTPVHYNIQTREIKFALLSCNYVISYNVG